MTWMACMYALAAAAADPSGSIRELKSHERDLLDEIDARILERRTLEHQSIALGRQIVAIEQGLREAEHRLETDAAAYARAELDARRRARQMDKLLRGQAVRFVLGADGLAEGIRRTRIIERAFRRDTSLLARALRAVEARRTALAPLASDRRHAEELQASARELQTTIDQKTQELQKTLLEIRDKRALEERVYYDLREMEAQLQRASEEEAVAATDPFAAMKGRLRWPLAGRVVMPFEPARGGMGIAGQPGAPVRAVAAGTVEWTGPVDGYEQVVIVRHSANYTSVYGGLTKLARRSGEAVEGGGPLGTLASGACHLELRRNAIPDNPEPWLEAR